MSSTTEACEACEIDHHDICTGFKANGNDCRCTCPDNPNNEDE